MTGYSDKAIGYYIKRLNVGKIKNPTISYTYTGECGDIMTIDLKIDSCIITETKFEVIGCTSAFSAGSAMTEMIKNLSIKDAGKITTEDIINHLGNVPYNKIDCVQLAIYTLQNTLNSLKSK